ncbi:MAG: hypothetical protein M3Y45_03095, partial [Actinomycetota bacterium]|nr:hypothetical protein [Actinomycetota bacterium]
MRLWLAAGFTLVCFLTATIVYLFINASSQDLLSERSTELAFGRTFRLADRLGEPDVDIEAEVAAANGEGFAAWYFDLEGNLVAPEGSRYAFTGDDTYRTVLESALAGSRQTEDLRDGEITVVGVPVVVDGIQQGAVVGRYSR